MNELMMPAINFGILVFALLFFTRKPVKNFVQSRHAAIKNLVQEAQVQKAESEKKYNEFNQKLKSFESEAQNILNQAKTDAENIKTKIIDNAKTTASRIIREAEETASANVKDFNEDVRKEIIDRAVALAEKLVRERLSIEDQKRIIHEYVGKVQ